jgi:hypothetical protein
VPVHLARHVVCPFGPSCPKEPAGLFNVTIQFRNIQIQIYRYSIQITIRIIDIDSVQNECSEIILIQDYTNIQIYNQFKNQNQSSVQNQSKFTTVHKSYSYRTIQTYNQFRINIKVQFRINRSSPQFSPGPEFNVLQKLLHELY